ncbi:hypothetical protein NLJ89_g9396 [Agrocybe chaxingu]|uniref:Uncharacterized protein n=1 Tax=Agrocybe chaxingu TaxID=84603 RepID=A0A9W8JTG1_9AGAR|nr:hypothetical protein NLJ89_g9396 [Agrocybe chaxingu]
MTPQAPTLNLGFVEVWDARRWRDDEKSAEPFAAGPLRGPSLGLSVEGNGEPTLRVAPLLRSPPFGEFLALLSLVPLVDPSPNPWKMVVVVERLCVAIDAFDVSHSSRVWKVYAFSLASAVVGGLAPDAGQTFSMSCWC